jgi:hypothetical protein
VTNNAPQGGLKQLLTHSQVHLSPSLCVIVSDPSVAHLLTPFMKQCLTERVQAFYAPLEVGFVSAPITHVLPP